MSSEQPDRTLADYVTLAISPALIMGLVGSLVFFLLEVLYAGQYQGRMQWILFFFVFGAVLIARVSMTAAIAKRAGLYAAVLGLLVWIALVVYVQYPADSPLASLAGVINVGLIGLIWWCAHRLTWDCTFADEDPDISGEGVLQAAGLDAKDERPPEPAVEEEEAPKPQTWWQRYQRYREEKKKRRTLGVWVIYFSLAALPVFGLGQSLIPPEAAPRRQYVFWLMTVYVGCGLGLLLTTCFLGLRRYLRQRKLHMPAAMTGVWLTVGTTLIVLLLLAGVFLPRPQAEYSVFSLGAAGSKKRDASKVSFQGENPGEGEGQSGADAPPDNKGPADGGGRKGTRGKGEKTQKGKGKSGGSSKGSQKGKGGSGEDRNDRQQTNGQKNKGSRGNDAKASRAGKKGPQGEKDTSSESDTDQKSDGEQTNRTGSSSRAGQGLKRLSSVIQKVAPVLKWVVFGVLGLIVVFVLLRSGLKFLANFTDWARRLLDALSNFWASLFGRKGTGESSTEEETPEKETPERPFASYPNPFSSGMGRLTHRQLVRYTFTALQAWARERDLGRQPGETPLEFALRVGREVPGLEEDVRRLGALYARAAYAPGALPTNTPEVVRQFWEQLEAVNEQPLSA